MVNCPIKECGRKFENDETMLQHVKRRHPNQYNSVRQDITKSLIQKEHLHQQQLSKLPKLAKILSNEPNTFEKLTEVRASSKTRKFESANLSSIIQQSRIATSNLPVNKNSIATRRPSLTKKNPSSDLKERLPPLQKELKKTLNSSVIDTARKQQKSEEFYTTLPNFSSKLEEKNRSTSKRKSKQKHIQSIKISEPLKLSGTMTSLSSTRNSEQSRNSAKKGLVRPIKKIQKKVSDKNVKKCNEDLKLIDFGQKIVTISEWAEKFFDCPSFGKIEILFLNNCGLSMINLNSLQSLVEISATHNNLKDMKFLDYNKNHNIRVIHLDHNQITSVQMPPKTKVFTASFNCIQAQSIYEVCAALKTSLELEEIDLSFNAIRKASNYKLKLLGICRKLKKIDGLTVTKIDIEMMEELAVMQSKQKGLIPLGQCWQQRPPTAISQLQFQTRDSQAIEKSINQLELQQKQYQKMILETEQQLKTITQQNEMIGKQLEQLGKTNKQISAAWESESLLKKLQKECEILQLLNILQYADQEELRMMIGKKKLQLGLPAE